MTYDEATWRAALAAAAKRCNEEAQAYRENAKLCDAAGNTAGGTADACGYLAARACADAVLALPLPAPATASREQAEAWLLADKSGGGVLAWDRTPPAAAGETRRFLDDELGLTTRGEAMLAKRAAPSETATVAAACATTVRRVGQGWAARCSCGWKSEVLALGFADEAANEHVTGRAHGRGGETT